MKKIWITIMILVFATVVFLVPIVEVKFESPTTTLTSISFHKFHTCNLHMFNSYSHTSAFIRHPRRPLRNIQLMVENHSNSDWENGLREAAIQALIMEHVGDRDLKKRLYSAPLLGKHDLKSTFGDISLVAKGQLYVNYAGYAFVQDEDCDYTFRKCQDWQPLNNEQLLALWLIKKIRQHSPRLRHPTFDLEYTIIPVDLKYPRQYLTYEGNYNYDLPGHVFTLKNFPLEKNQAKTEILILQPTEGRIYLPKQVQKSYRVATSSAELKMLYDYPSTPTNIMKQIVYPTEMTTHSTSAPLSSTGKTEGYKGISIINKQIVIANFYTLSPVNIYIPVPTASVNLMNQFSHMTTAAKETMLYTKITSTQSSRDTLTTTKRKTSVTKPFSTTSTIRTTTSTQKQKTEVYKDETTLKQTTVTASKIPLSTPKYKPATTDRQHSSSTVREQISTTSKKPTSHQPVLVPSTQLPSSTTRKKVYSTSTSTKKHLSTTLKSTVTTTKETTLITSTTKGSSLPISDHQTTQSPINSSGATQPMELPSLETTTLGIFTTPVLTTPSTVLSQETVTVHMMAPFTTTVESNQHATNTVKVETTVYQTAENSETAEVSSTKSTAAMANLSTMAVITDERDVKTTPEYQEKPIKSTTSFITPATTRKPSTTTAKSDFLVEDDDGGSEPISNQKPSKEYDDEDIFGPISPEKHQASNQQERSTKVYVPSDVEQSLFDGNRKSKALQISTETTYLPPIMPTSSTSPKSTTEIKNRPVFSVSKKPITASGDTVPVTSQSYLTSISYEVNNRNNKANSGVAGNGLMTDGSSETMTPEGDGTDAGNSRVKTVKRFRYKRKKTYRRNPKAGNNIKI